MDEKLGLVDVVQTLTSFRFISFNVGAILVCLTCLMYVGLRHRSDRHQNKLFLVIIIDVIIAAASDLSAGLARAYLEGFARSLDEVEKPCSAEALMRLHDSVLGNVPPFEFIEVAERMGLVDEIGEFALREVCSFIASGVPSALGIDHINVNLSVIQCMQAGFAERIKEIVESYDIDPSMVTFEITESVAARDYKFLAGVMGTLKGCGHRFAMDDFGTGYSNMHSLVALDFDVVKIDKSVLWDAEKSESGLVVLTSAVSLARNVCCDVLVEGVETKAQVELLHSLGADYYQGYYYARPMPKEEFASFLGNEWDSSTL